MFPDRIFSRPKGVSEHLIYDRNLRRVIHVTVCEVASRQDGNAPGLEITRRNIVARRGGILAFVLILLGSWLATRGAAARHSGPAEAL